MNKILSCIVLLIFSNGVSLIAQQKSAHNPIIFADVPDMSMIRVGNNYYMSSTTMHMNPGVPIMKSEDLVNWKLVNYAYETLGDADDLNLNNGKSMYSRGSWASCIRYHKDTYYVSTFSGNTGKTYIFKTKDIENGPWETISFSPSIHDHTIFFDDDGKTYIVWGVKKLRIAELEADLSGVKEGTEKVLIENANIPSGADSGLGEGSQLFKVNGKYYLFNITWPRGGMRTVVLHRADNIQGPWEGKLALQDLGVAQGGLIDTPEGKWYAYLFRDFGAVGRIPYLVPVSWENDWPVLGKDGKVPGWIEELPSSKGIIPGIVASDEFNRKKNEPDLPLPWQWNHNPDHRFWSVKERKGYLRLKTGRTDKDFLSARNTLTQRTFGPECSGSVCMDLSNMKEGDVAGFGLLQKKYGLVGVKFEDGQKTVFIETANADVPVEIESLPLKQNKLFIKAYCNFNERTDLADFYFSLNGKDWKKIGSQLKMEYTLPHFMGYRFALFNYATKTPGGFVDFNWFRVE